MGTNQDRMPSGEAILEPGRHAMRQSVISCEPVRLNVQHNNVQPGRTTILLVHGLGDSSAGWADAFAEDELQGFNLLAPDLAGYGSSSRCSPVNGDFEAHVKRLWQVVDHFADGPIVVVGHSMGGDITTLMCAGDQAGRIVGYVNVEGDLTPHDLFISGAAVRAAERGDFERWFRDELIANLAGPRGAPVRESARRYCASLRRCDRRAFLADARELVRRNTSACGACASEIGALYCELRLPKVFCWGTESLSAGTRELLAARALEQRAFSGAGHALMIDRAGDFYPFLHEFVDRECRA